MAAMSLSASRAAADAAARSWAVQSSAASCSYQAVTHSAQRSARVHVARAFKAERRRHYSALPLQDTTESHASSATSDVSWRSAKRAAPAAGLASAHQPQAPPLREKARRALAARDDSAPSSPFLRDNYARQHTYLRMSLTERCNLRCMYCMPLDGVPLTPNDKLLNADEVERIARLFVEQGVNKIRLTGGEPTIRKDLPDVIDRLSALRTSGLKQIGITTNGLTISRHIHHLVASGLTHLNVSLDTLDPFKFELMTRRPAKGIEKVLSGIEAALALGVPKVKINVVVIRGLNDGKDVLDFVEWIRDRDVVVRFIEYMPFDGNRWRPEKLVPYSDLLTRITQTYGPLEKVQDDANDTSKHWRVPGHKGSIGFITSMTDHFCGTCNRLRVTADGNLKVCLFGNAEVSLRDAMRGAEQQTPATDEQLLNIISAAVKRKHARHAGMADPVDLAKAPSSKLDLSMARRSRHESRTRRRLGFLPFAVPAPSLSTRFFSSSSRDPWDDIDEAADAYTRSSSSSQAEPANQAPMPSRSPSSDKPQSWSSYMGTDADGDDSPWASLDAFADGQANFATLPLRKAGPSAPRKDEEQSEPSAVVSQTPGMAEWDAMAIAAAEAYAKGSDTQSTPKHEITHGEHLGFSHDAETPRLTHVDQEDASRVSMVDVGEKTCTKRVAEATCRVYIDDVTLKLLKFDPADVSGQIPNGAHVKGPVLHTAQLAGIMGSKRTSELIPLCHGLNLSHVDVRLAVTEAKEQVSDQEYATLPEDSARHYITITCTASTHGSTGVEMEALTGASIASLTLWDMLKSVGGRTMRVDGLHVSKKTGGKSGDFVRSHQVA